MKKKILSILALSLVLGVGLASCAPAEPSVTVTQGEKGDTGPTGPKGDTGEKGDTGPIGPSGENGSDGKDGEKGDTGPTGDKGDTGPTGQDGEDGETAYSSTMLPVVGGYVTVDVGSATVGTPVTFTAIPEEGYRPIAVTLNGERHELSKDNGFKVTVNMVEGGFVVRGEFKIEKLVTSVELTAPETDTLFIDGESLTLEAKVLPEDATDTRIVWSSSDEKVATVDEKGVVTPVGVGEVTIRATAKDDQTKFAEQKLTVRYTTIAEAKEAVIANGNAETPTKTVDVTVAGVVQATWYDGAIIEDASGSMWIYGKNLGLTVGSYVEAVGGIQNYSHGYELANPEVTVLDLEKPEITATYEAWGAEQFTSWYNAPTSTTDKNEWYTINKIKFESRLVVDGNYVNGYIPGFTTTLSLKIDDDVKGTIVSGNYYALEGYVYGTDTNKTFVYVGISKLTPLAMPEATVLTAAQANDVANLYRRAVVSGQVKAIYDNGFILSDASGSIGYYEIGFAERNATLSDGLKVGDYAMVTGFIDQHNGTNQFTDEATITKLSSGDPVNHVAREISGEQLNTWCEDPDQLYLLANITAQYVQSGDYLNGKVTGSEYTLSLSFACEANDLIANANYEFEGYLVSVNSSKYVTFIVTSYKLVYMLDATAESTELVMIDGVAVTSQISYTLNPTNEEATVTFATKSGKENIIKVDEKGLVTSVGEGTDSVVVTAKIGAETATDEIEFKVTTVDHLLTLKADKTELTINGETVVGTDDTATITPTLTPAVEDAKYSYAVKAGSEEILKVDAATGKVTALAAGEGVVVATATYETDKTATAEITFTVTDLALPQNPTTLNLNFVSETIIEGTPTNYTNFNFKTSDGDLVFTSGNWGQLGSGNRKGINLGNNNSESAEPGNVPVSLLKGLGAESEVPAYKVGSNYYYAMYLDYNMTLASGSTVEVTWLGSYDTKFEEANLLYSIDDGATWISCATAQTKAGSIKYTLEEGMRSVRFAFAVEGTNAKIRVPLTALNIK